jgi:glycosyltransferase involved in cell wall biosynthesis
MKKKRIAVVTVRPMSHEKGGAERLFEGLVSGLNASGVEAELVNVLSDESSFESIEETYLRCYDLDVSAYDAVISTKAPTYLLRHPNHICYLVHTMRVFYDMFNFEFPNAAGILKKQRELIHKLDTGALSFPRTRKVFTIGNEVRQRLLKWNNINSEVLHPALSLNNFKKGHYNSYLFMPGRLHRWKRVDLVIKAMQYVKNPVRLRIAGTGEDEAIFHELATKDHRIEFLGRVSDEELINLYANALAVPYVPRYEDYGYITIEAFSCAKPVITCEDSGEPTLFVENWKTGFVCKSNPKGIAEKIDYLYEHPHEAKAMGERGKHSISGIRWENIASKLLSYL